MSTALELRWPDGPIQKAEWFVSLSRFCVATTNGSNYYIYQTLDIGKYGNLADAGLLGYTAGATLSGSGRMILQGLSSTGGVLWEKTYSSTGSSNEAVLTGTRKVQVLAGGPVGAAISNMNFSLRNTFPSMTVIADQSVTGGSSTGDLPFTVGYSGNTVALTATSSNTTLIPVSNISFGGSIFQRTVNIATQSGTSGTSTITIYADGTALRSFVVTVVSPPGKPTNVSAVGSAGYATVSFTAPASDGGSAITGYTVTSSIGGYTATGTASPIMINVANGTKYTFTVTAANDIGTSQASDASNEITAGIASTVVLTAAPESNSTYGDSVILTATVQKADGAAMPGGTVVFKDGATALGSAVTVNSEGKATYTTTAFTAGTHTFYAEYSGDSTYLASTGTLSYSVGKANQSAITFTAISSDVTVAGHAPFDLGILGGNGTGDLLYEVTAGDAISISGHTATVNHIGTVTVRVTKAADANFNAQTATTEITITKAVPVISVNPSASDIVLGTRLSTSLLSGGTSSTPGTYQWTNPDTLIMAAGSYEVTFTPTDTTNYTTVSFNISVAAQPTRFNAKITVAANDFNTFLNTITFGLFFKNTITVSITGDVGTGGTIKYQKVVKKSDYSPDGWTAYTSPLSLDPNQSFIIYALLSDSSGNQTIITSQGVVMDHDNPDLNATAGTSGWISANAVITVNAADSLSGLTSVTYATDETIPQTGSVLLTGGTGTITLSNAGQYTLTVTAVDNANNSTSKTVDIKIDKTAPTISVTGNPTAPVQSKSLAITATAGISGKTVTVSKDSGTPVILTEASYTVSENGSYKFVVTNGTGATAEQTVDVTQIDRVKPVVSINSHGYASGSWKNANVTLDISNSSTNLGTTVLEYRLNGGAFTAFAGNIVLSSDSVNIYQFRATSESGMVSDIADFTVKGGQDRAGQCDHHGKGRSFHDLYQLHHVQSIL